MLIDDSKYDQNRKPEFTFVSAGAGAGKTTNLVNHIVNTYVLYKKNTGKWPRIIGTTFTRKAANEIKERVAKQYQKFSPGNENLLTELDLANPHRRFIEDNLEDLLNFAYSESLNITTIHGICIQIILKKAYLLGFSPALRIVSENSLRFFQKKTLFKYMEEAKYAKLYDYFSFVQIIELMNELETQKNQIERPVTPDDLDRLYQELIHEIKEHCEVIFSYSLENIGNLGNQTEKVREFANAIQRSLKKTFEQNDLEVFKNDLESFGRAPAPRGAKCDESDIERFNEFKEEYTYIRDTYFKSEAYSKYFNKTFFKEVCDINQLVFELYQKYVKDLKQYKKEQSIVLMSEVEHIALEILKTFPEECQDFIDMWDYWYIDEYQDTSPIQGEIFKILLKDKSYYKVGDPQQSIYLFRGAESSLFTEEWNEAQERHDVEAKELNTNYRSHPNLMAGMNEFFAHLEGQSEDLNEVFKPMLSAKDVEASEVSRFHLYYFSSDEDEKQFVLNEVEKLKKQGVSSKNICILARSRKLLKEYEQALTFKKIPSLAQFSGGFLIRPEIQGLICFLKVMSNPHNDIELVRLFRTQNFKVADSILKKWTEVYKLNRSWSLWDSLKKQEHPSILKIKSFCNYFKEKDYVDGIQKYLAELQVLNSGYDLTDVARRNANLMKAYSYVCKKSESGSYTLDKIIEDFSSADIEELQSEASFSQSQEGVRLFTIHGSKGLEFEYVFLIGGGKKGALSHSANLETIKGTGVFVIPIISSVDRESKGTVLRYFSHKNRIFAEKKEIRRVIYVAATRAKEKLYVSGAVKVKRNSKDPELKTLSANDQSLFKIIDIDEFSKNSWKYISTVDGTKEEERLNTTLSYQYLKFESENIQTEDLAKLVFEKKVIQKKVSRDVPLVPYSVSALVEKMVGTEFQNFQYEIVSEIPISKIDFSYLLATGETKSKLLKEQFLKPYIGDIFHKAIELYSHKVSEDDLKSYLAKYFMENYEPIYNLISEIANIKTPNMEHVLQTARPEWGFNSILENKILLSGQIDLWGFDENQTIHILDYKTGSKYHLKKAAFQLALYKDVLKKLYPKNQIQTHVIYPAEGIVISVEILDKIFFR